MAGGGGAGGGGGGGGAELGSLHKDIHDYHQIDLSFDEEKIDSFFL